MNPLNMQFQRLPAQSRLWYLAHAYSGHKSISVRRGKGGAAAAGAAQAMAYAKSRMGAFRWNTGNDFDALVTSWMGELGGTGWPATHPVSLRYPVVL